VFKLLRKLFIKNN